MYLTGFADEAASSIDGQIRVTKELGWENIESRNIDGVNIHSMDDAAFDVAVGKLKDAGVKVNCFGSEIANWGKSVEAPFEETTEMAARAIKRMKVLDTKLVRIMSYGIMRDRGPWDQMEEERFRRLRVLVEMFGDAGITAVHENCMNYGGMSPEHMLKLIDNVPGLKIVYDTGNPVFTFDFSKDEPWPKQNSWEYYQAVKEHIAYVHIKDGVYKNEVEGSIFPNSEFTMPGKGDGDVVKIVSDLIKSGYDGGLSIEPHLAVVFHDESVQSADDVKYANYVEYGKQLEAIIAQAKAS